MANINKDNLSQIKNMTSIGGMSGVRRKGKKYPDIFPTQEGIQISTSERNEEALLDVDRKKDK